MSKIKTSPKLTIQILPGDYAVCQFLPGNRVPEFPGSDDLYALIQTPEEVTVISPEESAPTGGIIEPGWRALKVVGPLDFSLVGILAHLAGCLAAADISIFALSTYDTDYLLVKAENLLRAQEALARAGHKITKK